MQAVVEVEEIHLIHQKEVAEDLVVEVMVDQVDVDLQQQLTLVVAVVVEVKDAEDMLVVLE